MARISNKADGKRVVAAVFTGMVAMVGIGVVWLPYISDRDKIRGMAEDENMTEDERFRMMRELSLAKSQQQAQQQSGDVDQSRKMRGSMWKNMSDSQKS